jgi:hypothetical protein
MDKANYFSTVKSASASIAFFHTINLFNSLHTLAPEVCMVGTATDRNFELLATRVKEAFIGFNLSTLLYFTVLTIKGIVMLLFLLWPFSHLGLGAVIGVSIVLDGEMFNLIIT